MHRLTLTVPSLNRHNAAAFERAVVSAGASSVDTWEGRAVIAAEDAAAAERIIAAASQAGFAAVIVEDRARYCVSGMTCKSCEITVEQDFAALGVEALSVDAVRGEAALMSRGKVAPDASSLQRALSTDAYTVSENAVTAKPSLVRPAAALALAAFGAYLLSRNGLFGASVAIDGTTSFFSAIILGLVAGTSACAAVSGGFMLSVLARRRADEPRTLPVVSFLTGRVASYALFGGVIGLVGRVFTPSPAFTGVLTLLVAAFMIISGLDMLGVMPRWFAAIVPRMPKVFSRRALKAGETNGRFAPLIAGAATFFLPCGFTQALQLYALTTRSPFTGAMILGGFALGTAPVLAAIGAVSRSAKGRWGEAITQFAGAVVVVLGCMNVTNGFAVMGVDLAAAFSPGASAVASVDKNVTTDGHVQMISMKLVNEAPFYLPTNTYTVRAGEPVKLTIDGAGEGCRSVFQIPKFGVRVALQPKTTQVTFTPDQPGDAVFSCSMGMYRGMLHVVGRS